MEIEKGGGVQGTLSDGHSGFMVTLFHLASHHSDESGCVCVCVGGV